MPRPMDFWHDPPVTTPKGIPWMPCGIIVNFYPKFATIERCFYDADKREILTSDGKPSLDRQLGAGELARAPKTSCFQQVVSCPQKVLR